MTGLVRFLVIAVAVALAVGCTSTPTEIAPLPEDKRRPAPNFELMGLDGKKRSLADYKGKPLLVNFWASYCGPCREEMPDIAALAKQHSELQVIAIAVSDTPADSKKFLKEVGVRFDTGMDPRGDTLAEYGGTGLPLTVAVNKDGQIVAWEPGLASKKKLDEMADLIL